MDKVGKNCQFHFTDKVLEPQKDWLPQVESWDQNSGPLTPRKDLVVLLDRKLYLSLTWIPIAEHDSHFFILGLGELPQGESPHNLKSPGFSPYPLNGRDIWHLLDAICGHCSKFFTCINSYIHTTLRRQSYYYPHLTNGKIKIQGH